MTLRLHIGGHVAAPGWTVLDVQPGPAVDVVGVATDLGPFAEGSVDEIYASHVYEHLSYREELPRALAEAHRVLVPGGRLRLSVPDLAVLCRLFSSGERSVPERFHLMRMMFGGQMDAHDFHKAGLTAEFLAGFLHHAGFIDIRRVEEHGLFEDSSSVRFGGQLISLNLTARKPG